MFHRKKISALGLQSTAIFSASREVVLILDDVRSMHNVGSAFRTADAFGVKALWLCGYTPAPPHRDIHKTALGAELTVPWKKFEAIGEALDAAFEGGYEIAAAEQAEGATLLQDYSAAAGKKIALVFGNEVTGVSNATLAAARHCIEIPQAGQKHSLNVSVAMGVILWAVLQP